MSLENRTPSVAELLDRLVKSEYDAKSDPPGSVTRLRRAFVADGRKSTYRIHADFPTDDPNRWRNPNGCFPQWLTNDAEWLVDGEDAYGAIHEAMATATGSDHWIIMLGWSFRVDFVMGRSDRSPFGQVTMLQVLQDRLANHECNVRILLYDNPLCWPISGKDYRMGDACDALEELKKTYDKRLVFERDATQRESMSITAPGNAVLFTAHHQKVVLVRGSEGLIGFFGGIDVYPDRVQVSEGEGRLHDVHARVRGPAAASLLEITEARWNYCVGAKATKEPTGQTGSGPYRVMKGKDATAPFNRLTSDLEDAALWGTGSEPDRSPSFAVQLAQTIGNPQIQAKYTSDAWPMVKGLLAQAKRLIYVEDQYFWSLPFADALAAAVVERKVAVLVLLPRHDVADGADLRLRALARFYQQINGDPLAQVYQLRSHDHFYIHAKMGVVDDQAAWIGSMNENNRGNFHDSETVGSIADLPWTDRRGSRTGFWDQLELNLAHKLRMTLWGHHLLMSPADFYDGVASLWRWPLSGRVKEYEIEGKSWKYAAAMADPVDGTPVHSVKDPLP